MMLPALAEGLRDEIAPTGKLRVAIAISPAGGAFWCTKTEHGYAGVPVDLGKSMAAELGVPVEYVVHQNSGQITDAATKGTWDVAFLPKDPEREAKMSFGPIYEVADATYIVKPGSTVTNFATLDRAGVKVAAVNNTTTMRGAQAHLKNAKVTGYQTYDETFNLLKNGEVDAFALSRDQLNAMAKKIPGTKVLDETFKKTVTAVCRSTIRSRWPSSRSSWRTRGQTACCDTRMTIMAWRTGQCGRSSAIAAGISTTSCSNSSQLAESDPDRS